MNIATIQITKSTIVLIFIFFIGLLIVGCAPLQNITTGWDYGIIEIPSKSFHDGYFLEKVDTNSGKVPSLIALFDSNYVIFRNSSDEKKWPIKPEQYESALWTTHGQYVFTDSLLIIQAPAAVIAPNKNLNMVRRYILHMNHDSTFCLVYGRSGFYHYDENDGEKYFVLTYQADTIKHNNYKQYINLVTDKGDSLVKYYSDNCEYIYKTTIDSIPSSVLNSKKGKWVRLLPKSAL